VITKSDLRKKRIAYYKAQKATSEKRLEELKKRIDLIDATIKSEKK
jgi:hypothetical protein